MREGGNSCGVISKDNNHTLLPDTQDAIGYNTSAQSKACQSCTYSVNINSRDTSLQSNPAVLCPLLKTPPASTPSIAPHCPSHHLNPKVLSQDSVLSQFCCSSRHNSPDLTTSSKCACQTNKDRLEARKNWAETTTPLYHTRHLIT